MGSQLQLTPFITELFLFFLLIFPICACAHIICYIDLFSVQGATLNKKKAGKLTGPLPPARRGGATSFTDPR